MCWPSTAREAKSVIRVDLVWPELDRGRIWYGSVADFVRGDDPFPMSTDEMVRAITGVHPVQRLDGDRLHMKDGVGAAG